MAKFVGIGAGLALVLALSFGLAAPGRAADPTADTVVATINGTDITLGHMIALRQTLPEQYQSLADDVLFKGILEQLIQQTALAQEYQPKLTKRDAIMMENQTRAYVSGADLQTLVDGAVTDAALQSAYDAKYKDATPATEYHAAHILVATEQEAKDLKTQLDGGADFAELAKAHSSDGSAQNGGDLGWFGLGAMVKPFEDAVVGLKAGDVSGPVQSQFGFHLIKLIETRNAASPKLEDVRSDLASEIERKVIADHVTALTAKAKITRTEGIDPKLLRDQTLLGK